MTDFFLKNRFTDCVLKNWLSITIKKVHATCRNIKTLLRVIRLIYMIYDDRKELYIVSQTLILPQLQQALDSAIEKKESICFPKKKKINSKSLTS